MLISFDVKAEFQTIISAANPLGPNSKEINEEMNKIIRKIRSDIPLCTESLKRCNGWSFSKTSEEYVNEISNFPLT